MSTSTSSATVENVPARKFMFERTFTEGSCLEDDEREAPKPTFTEDQLEAAKRASYEAGYLAGEKAKIDEKMKQIADVLSSVNKKLEALQKAGEEFWRGNVAHAQTLALTIAKKIVPSYIEKSGIDEIKDTITRVINEMSREPRLVIRVNEALFEQVNAKIAEISERAAYAGKVVVLGEAGLGPTDCKIEWADGGIERDTALIWRAIDKIMGHSAAPEEQPPQQTDNAGEKS